MKLFLISQTVHNGCDTYDYAVVVSESEKDAATIHPRGEWRDEFNAWADSPDQVSVEYIGEAKIGSKRGVILASFNGG